MHLPEELKSQIEQLIYKIPLSELIQSSEQLTYQYQKKGNSIATLGSEKQRLAYLLTRFPATYAVVYKVLSELRARLPDLYIGEMADIGAGPGTAMWAALEHFYLSQVTLYERDGDFIALGKKLASNLGVSQKWIRSYIEKNFEFQKHDLIIASYSLGEIAEEERMEILTELWKATKKVLIIIEPGTPVGFKEIRKMRESLIEKGAHLIAPCPHANTCPIKDPDWCHFYARVERSSFHRQIKKGTLNFEDEKFSYLIFSREPNEAFQRRILRHPQKNSGFVKLEICSVDGIQKVTFTKQSKEEYRHARKSEWGDTI